MAKRKLERFAQLKQFPNVIESVIEDNAVPNHAIKGNWRKTYFKNNHPIVVELGCGKGEYTVGLARFYPEKNFIGIDIKGNRMWVGAKDALDQQLKNVDFIRTRVDFVNSFFAQNEIDEIWLTFSDPQPGKENKRLSSPRFMERYKKILKPQGCVHLKTDSDLLFDYTCAQIEQKKYPLLYCSNDLYGENMEKMDSTMQEILGIKTHYEQLFSAKGFRIKYCKFLIH